MNHTSTANLGWIVLTLGAALIFLILWGLVAALRAVTRNRADRRFAAEPVPLPAEIMAALSAVPLLEQASAAKAYRGMPVRWPVTFESAFASGLTTLRLMCQDRGDYPWVLCDVRKGRYPQLRGLLPHAAFWITGRIANIKGDEIYLRQVQLEFEE